MMKNLMNTKSIYVGLLIGLFAGCGKKSGGSGHSHGESSGAGGSATIQKPTRPPSKLKEVKPEEAWKTPLNLALFTVQQYKGKRSYGNMLSAVVIALVEVGELGQATEVALLFPKGSGAFMLSYIAKAAAEAGNVALALKVAQWIEPPGARAIALCQVATAQAKAGDKQAAWETIRQTTSDLIGKIPEKEKMDVLIATASAQVATREMMKAAVNCQSATKLLRTNTKSYLKPQVSKKIARVLISAGQIEQAKGLMQSDGLMYGWGGVQREMAVIMAEAGELEAALEWVGQFPNKQNKAQAYGDIASALARKGQFARAMEVLENDKSRFSSKSQAMKNIAVGMVKAGKINEAIELVSRMRGGMAQMARAPALLAIASAQVAAGQKEVALATLKQAEEAGDKVAKIFLPKHDVNIAIGLAEAGEKEQAVAKLKQAVEAAKVYEKNQFSSASKESTIAMRLMDLLPAVINVADKDLKLTILKQVVDLPQRIEDANEKANTLSLISRRLAQAGQYKQAMETVQLIEAAERKKSAMQGLARVLPVFPETNMRLRHINFIDIKRMKKSFTPEEQEFAKKLVDAIQAK